MRTSKCQKYWTIFVTAAHDRSKAIRWPSIIITKTSKTKVYIQSVQIEVHQLENAEMTHENQVAICFHQRCVSIMKNVGGMRPDKVKGKCPILQFYPTKLTYICLSLLSISRFVSTAHAHSRYIGMMWGQKLVKNWSVCRWTLRTTLHWIELSK